MDKRGVFRVNYYENNQPKTALIVALSDVEAGTFLGVTNVPGVQITRDRYPVEVDGLDAPHAEVAPPAVEKAPFDLPKNVSRNEFNALQQEIAELRSQLSGAGKPVSPVNQPQD